jgi:protein-L-isoaspartate(D-aspartate) O-methyltransferase
MADFRGAREHMIRRHIEARGIRDPNVLAALWEVPREAFVPPHLSDQAYDDAALPIGEGQTISQPYIVALMAAAMRLSPNDRVLEVGTGSGYAAAVLGRIAREVFTIERHPALAADADETLRRLGFANVHVVLGDGSLGLAEHAPYDAISVAAGGPGAPPALIDQLALGGRLVIPIGAQRTTQDLVRITRASVDRTTSESLCGVRFIPLIGAQGWDERDER